MVKVRHDDREALMLLTQEVVYRHLRVFKLNVRRRRGSRVGSLYPRCLYRITPGYQNNRESLIRLAPHDEVIAKHAVGDPLLRAIDNVVLTISRFLCCGPQASNI